MNKVFFGWFFCIVVTIFSCTKPIDFVDDTSQYPIGWMSTDTFDLVCNTVLDSIGNIQNLGTCPLGSTNTSDFGQFNSASFLQFQTTTSSLSFGFSTLDSAYLIIPYYKGFPIYGSATTPYNLEVYELTEALDSINSTKMDYQYNPSPVGVLNNYIPNYTDSVYDGAIKIRPSIKIPLSLELAKKLIAPGSYPSNSDFHNQFKGLYIKTTNDTKGFINIETSTSLKIKLYGTGSTGLPITSEFITGSTGSKTINQTQRDPSSKAYLASQLQSTTGSSSMYLRGLYGYYGSVRLPNLSQFAKNKNIFKAEIIFYSTDTAFAQSPQLGMTYKVDSTNTISLVDDQRYFKNFEVSVNKTNIQGVPAIEYKYNLGMFVNNLIANGASHKVSLKVYPYEILYPTNSGYFISSNYFVPALATLGGNLANTKPRLKLYYTNF